MEISDFFIIQYCYNHGTRPRGRPRTTWLKEVREDMAVVTEEDAVREDMAVVTEEDAVREDMAVVRERTWRW